MIKNVIPFFLDKPSKETSVSWTWDGSTSFIDADAVSAGITITLPTSLANGQKIQPGTIVSIGKSDSTTNTVLISMASSLDASFNVSYLTAIAAVACFMFKNNANGIGQWVAISSDTPWAGGTVSQDVTFSGSVLFHTSIKMDIDTTTPAAAGSTSGDATLVTFTDPVQLVSSDDATKGIKLATQTNESVYKLINTTDVAMLVYPVTPRTTINGAVSYTLAANAVVDVIYGNVATAIYIG